MNHDQDPLAWLSEELKIAPSAQFERDLMTRIELEPPPSRSAMPALSLTTLIVLAVVGFGYGRVRERALSAPPIRAIVTAPEPTVASSVTAARRPLARELNGRQTLASRASRHAVVRPFDPFSDVLIDPADRRGFRQLRVRSKEIPALPELEPLSLDQPVRVVALSVPAPVEIPFLDADVQAGTNDGQVR